jgi:hypothetical protein
VLGKDTLVGGPDPFAWLDSKYKVSKKLLEKNFDKPLEIHTRSDLIAHDDYIAALNPNKHKVYMHIISMDESFNRALEPGQPSALRRIQAAKKLYESGVSVTIAHDVFENRKLSEEVKKLNRLDELKMHKYAKGVKIKPFPVKISDKAASIVNDAINDKNLLVGRVQASSERTTYKDLFEGYVKDKNEELLAVLRTPHDDFSKTSVWFNMHALCGMENPDTKLPDGYEWDAYPIDDLKPEHKRAAMGEPCALGKECLYEY